MEPLGAKISKDLSMASYSKQADPDCSHRVIACRFQFPQQTPTCSYKLGQNSVWVYDHFK